MYLESKASTNQSHVSIKIHELTLERFNSYVPWGFSYYSSQLKVTEV